MFSTINHIIFIFASTVQLITGSTHVVRLIGKAQFCRVFDVLLIETFQKTLIQPDI